MWTFARAIIVRPFVFPIIDLRGVSGAVVQCFPFDAAASAVSIHWSVFFIRG